MTSTITFSKVVPSSEDGANFSFTLLIGDNSKSYTFESESGAKRGRAKMFRAVKKDGHKVTF